MGGAGSLQTVFYDPPSYGPTIADQVLVGPRGAARIPTRVQP
jgi:hypothetical protein